MPALVSIIIPLYNRQELVKETLDSILAQTYTHWECVIVDDGSTDDSMGIARDYAEKDNRFKVFRRDREPKGGQTCRNIGFEKSAGDYIQYLDSDDLLYEEKLYRQVEYLRNQTDCDGVFGDWEVGTPDEKEQKFGYQSEDFLSEILRGRTIPIYCFLFRRDAVDKIGKWDTDIRRNQEVDFHLRGLMRGLQYQYQVGMSGLWRQHGESQISKINGGESLLNFYRKWEDILKTSNKWTPEISEEIAKGYLWQFRSNKIQSRDEGVKLLKEIYRLDEHILLDKNNRKIQVLSRFLNNKTLFRILLGKYLINGKIYL